MTTPLTGRRRRCSRSATCMWLRQGRGRARHLDGCARRRIRRHAGPQRRGQEHAAACHLRPRAQAVRQRPFQRQDLTHASPREIVKAGIVQVLEGHRVFTHSRLRNNLLIGTYAQHPHGDRSKLERIYTLFPELAEHRHQMASRLSGGQQQILAVGQGVIGDPKC